MGKGEGGRREQGALEHHEMMEILLTSARDLLDMDVAFVSEFSEDRLVFRALVGEAESFGWEEGQSIPLEGSFCKRLIDEGRLGPVPDAREDARTRDLEVTREAGIGSYVGVPLVLSDGRLYGMLCCVSRAPNPYLAEYDLEGLKKLARQTVEEIERDGLV